MKKALFYFLAALMGGCVPVMSLHPLYSKDKHEVVFDKKLLGLWTEVKDPNVTWHFKKGKLDGEERSYELIVTDEKGKKGVFVVHLLKLDGKLFLDVFPAEFPCEEDSSKWPYNSFFFVPAHTFLKADSVEPKLELRLTDDEKLRKLLEEEPQAVKYEMVDKTPVLIASPKELQRFLKKHADDSLFEEPIVLIKKVTGEDNTALKKATESKKVKAEENSNKEEQD